MAIRRISRTALPCGVAVVLAGATALPAMAQSRGAVSAEADDLVEIIVTARKRSEDILEIPVSVSALSGEDIEQRGLVSIADIARNSPGVNFTNNSSGRADRSNAQIIVRGFTPSVVQNSAASIFIDGVPVASATAVENVNDPARVEIIKGPQSAIFGRSTFSGAVNIVTKDPLDTFGGAVSLSAGSRDHFDGQASFSGPIFGEKLSFRATVRKFEKGGSWKNHAQPGQMLGDQSTRNATLALMSKPTENLTIKAFGMITKAEDGPSAQGFLSAYELRDRDGNVVVPNRSNCTFNGLTGGSFADEPRRLNPSICGTIPDLIAPYSPAQNTTYSAQLQAFRDNPAGALVDPRDRPDGFGLRSMYNHGHLAVNYDFGDSGFSFSSLTGFNNEVYSTLVDVDNYDGSNVPNTPQAGADDFFSFPFIVERKNHDMSQELRLSYDGKGRLRATGGVSYLDARTQSLNGGGNLVRVSGGTVLPAVFQGGFATNETRGVFASVSYDVTDALTIDVEGRYQSDTLRAYAPNSATGGVTIRSDVFGPEAGFYAYNDRLLETKFKNFTPRVIVSYDFRPGLMAYLSYSKGVNPAFFNTSFLTQPADRQAALVAQGFRVQTDPEKVVNYEIGVKGSFFGSRLRLASAVYFADWTDQINTVGTLVLNANGTTSLVTASVNSGETEMRGIEVEGSWAATDRLTFNFAAAVNDSETQTYRFPLVSQLTGILDFEGKQLPFTSRSSATLGAQYDGSLPSFDDADWYLRADVAYKSGTYTNVANVAKTPTLTRVNLRAGIVRGSFGLDVFVLNALNSDSYLTALDNNLLNSTFAFSGAYSAIVVGLPDLRTYGAKLTWRF
ncbi:MAG: TonB-dependent receptor [Steroidobacteraceae bacterium]